MLRSQSLIWFFQHLSQIPWRFILCLFVFALLYFPLFLLALICPRNTNRGQCCALILSPLHTCELASSHYSPFSSSSAVSADELHVLVYTLKTKRKKVFCSSTLPKGLGIWSGNLPVTKLCLKAIAVLFIMKHDSKLLLQVKVWFLWQNLWGQIDSLLCNKQ